MGTCECEYLCVCVHTSIIRGSLVRRGVPNKFQYSALSSPNL